MRLFHAQGATEYLVLLAVVLIVALVSVALLGFFPGMASDAQITQSQAYWKGTGQIAVTESAARYSEGWSQRSISYIMLRNNGAYPIRITKILGGSNATSYSFYCFELAFCGSAAGAIRNFSDYYYLAPGEEKYIGGYGLGLDTRLWGFGSNNPNYADYARVLFGAASMCRNSSADTGAVIVNDFGFEYTEYIEGQQITKRFVGAKPLIIKCREPY